MLLLPIILLFIGKLIAAYHRGAGKITSGGKWMPLLTTFLRAGSLHHEIAFTTVAALGRVGIETSSLLPLSARRVCFIGPALQVGHFFNFCRRRTCLPRPFRAGEIVQIGLGTAQ